MCVLIEVLRMLISRDETYLEDFLQFEDTKYLYVQLYSTL